MKLVKAERGSKEARAFVAGASLVSSELTVTEVPRALRRTHEGASSDPTEGLRQAAILLDVIELRAIDPLILWRAGRLFDPHLGSLDAIHLTTALSLRPIAAFLTYDLRQARAARGVGLPVRSPGA